MKSTVGTEPRILIHVSFAQLSNESLLYAIDYIKSSQKLFCGLLFLWSCFLHSNVGYSLINYLICKLKYKNNYIISLKTRNQLDILTTHIHTCMKYTLGSDLFIFFQTNKIMIIIIVIKTTCSLQFSGYLITKVGSSDMKILVPVLS